MGNSSPPQSYEGDRGKGYWKRKEKKIKPPEKMPPFPPGNKTKWLKFYKYRVQTMGGFSPGPTLKNGKKRYAKTTRPPLNK